MGQIHDLSNAKRINNLFGELMKSLGWCSTVPAYDPQDGWGSHGGFLQIFYFFFLFYFIWYSISFPILYEGKSFSVGILKA